jgi:cyclophilin family peptidyl-prolyl cis-trans isomerase
MAAIDEELTPPSGRNLAVPLVIALVLVALAVAGSAYGAKRTEEGVLVAAKRTTTTADPEAPVPGPPVARPVKAGTKITGDTPCPKADGSSPRADSFEKEPPPCIDPKKTYTATFKTSAGTIVASLDPTKKAANNFIVLARYHYYDGASFYQTIPNLDVVVGGNPHTQTEADPGPGYTFVDEPPGVTVDPETGRPKGPFTYTPGVLGMAPIEKEFDGGAKFFFGAGKNVAQLDQAGVYLAFGQITRGLEVAEKVLHSHVPCSPTDPECLSGGPNPAVVITSVTIQES